MQSIFITGIPTAGKSHLARKLSSELNFGLLDVDTLRSKMRLDPKLKIWVDFFFNLDEKAYYKTVSSDQQWQNMVDQSEAFWPTIKSELQQCLSHGQYIFEGVNLLPHLVKELGLQGAVLLGESFEQVLERNKRNPRWGDTEELQKMEAESFFSCEREKYREEAEKYNFKWFENNEEAYQYLKKLALE
jgi:2-phosphoglycerate kinase